MSKDGKLLAQVAHELAERLYEQQPIDERMDETIIRTLRAIAARENLAALNRYLNAGKIKATRCISGRVFDPEIDAAGAEDDVWEVDAEQEAIAICALGGCMDTANKAEERADEAKEILSPESPVKPVQRTAAHQSVILAKLRDLGFDPKALPAPSAGKRSQAKKAAQEALPSMSDAVFKKAWQALRNSGEIVCA